jgi:hypothetical protein
VLVAGIVFLGVLVYMNNNSAPSVVSTPIPTDIPTTPNWVLDLQAGAATFLAETKQAEIDVPEDVKQNCVLWSEVTASHVHSGVCIYGAIGGWGVDLAEPSLTAVSFGDGNGSGSHDFYLIAPEPDWTKNKFSVGDCIVVKGDITTDILGAPKVDGREYSTSITSCSEYVP